MTCVHCIDIIEHNTLCELNKPSTNCDRYVKDKWINEKETVKNNKITRYKGETYTIQLKTITTIYGLTEPNKNEAIKHAKEIIQKRNTDDYKTTVIN